MDDTIDISHMSEKERRDYLKALQESDNPCCQCHHTCWADDRYQCKQYREYKRVHK